MTTGEYQEAPGAGRLLAGRYRTVRQLGRGGMGVVWQATDEVLGRDVAVKELRTYTDSAGSELADMQLRMQREARAAARVRHPSVIAVHDVTEVEGRPLIVMELVDGPSLDDVLRERGNLDPQEAAAVGADVLDALAAAHRVGVLHRDVKPGNILLDRSGRTVLTDFGIATMDDPGDGSATHLTRSGEIVGSLDYLAPERAQGRQPGPASDIWAVGATLYAAVEGASPFRRTSTWSTLSAIVAEPLPVPRRAGPLMPVLEQLMAKEPERRPDAARAAALLREVATGGTAPAAPGATLPGTSGAAPAAASTAAPAGAFATSPAPAAAGGYGYPGSAGPSAAPGYGYPAPAAYGAPAPGPAHGGPVVGAYSATESAAPGPLVGAPGGPAAPGPYGGGYGAPGPSPYGGDTASEPRRRRKRGSALIAGVAVAVVLAATGVGVALMGGSDGERDEAGPAGGGAPAGSTSEPSPDGSRGSIGGDKESGGDAGPDEKPEADESKGTPDASADPEDEDRPSGKPDPEPDDDESSEPATRPTTDPGGEAPAPAPVCADIGGGKFNCEVWRTAKSYNSGGAEVGVLYAGTNYFYCQQNLGRRETAGEWTNVWSAKTDDDSGNAGVWVNVVNMKGGDNDAPLPGLPYC